ncbi:MAG: hypothetical protein IPJ89_04190 [Candidatus Iainarchaeum archaeon]|uniref:CYTH domain-containing protein n=1 Tax=Candidatus Iainarchaeum sp. TaxID=3101447 RepID=A0A7T9DJ69_9ARCH|nr:MAG: hypothetical protein IPJ89_04190 [Candidatus Diapherotrites archaeon]
MEVRGRIQDIAETHRLIAELGGIKLNTYAFEDRIYFLPGTTSLEKGYVRIRSPPGYDNSQRFQITKKITQDGQRLEVYRSFASDLERAKAKIAGHWIACIIARKGTQYRLGNGLMYVEEIEEFGNSIEALYSSEVEGREWLHQLNATEISMHSMPLQFMIHKNMPKHEPAPKPN